MANWICILDPDAERREQCLSAAAAQLAPVAGLRTAQRDGSGWSLAWAAAPAAPIDIAEQDDSLAVVFGEPRDAAGALRCATDLQAAWRRGDAAPADGYFCALGLDAGRGTLTVATDVLGLFPVYYWSSGDGVSLVTSSPALLRHHPLFDYALDMRGLVGILLTSGLVGGRTLWQRVTRLAPGKRLGIIAGVASEIDDYALPDRADIDDIPFRGHLKALDRAMRAAVARQTASGADELAVMLSGGMDSRQLAGYLADQGGLALHGLTFGDASDHEMRCARKVARASCASHTAVPLTDDFADSEKLARWEHLAAGFTGLYEWGYHDAVAGTGERIVVGHLLDRVLGGIQVGKAYDSRTRSMGFEHVLQHMLEWGIGPQRLRGLLRVQHHHLIDEVLAELRAHYESLNAFEHVRAWLFDLHYRQRFHVGAVLWPTSFAAWPIVPALDRALLECCAEMPAATLADRRAQLGLLRTYHPDLARLPMDRNSPDTMPETPSLGDFVRRSISYRTARLKSLLGGGRAPAEPIFYRRIYDFESPRWREIRRQTETHRALLHACLQRDGVDAIWPAHDAVTAFANPVSEPNPARLLIGLAMVLSDTGCA